MSDYQLQLLRSLSQEQRLAFQAEYEGRKKDATAAILLALFLGGVGAHHFYLGRSGLGILYLLFCWTLIPSFLALIECFFLGARVQTHNDRLATEIASKVRLLYSSVPANTQTVAAARYCTGCGKPMLADSHFCASCGKATGLQLST